MIVEIDETGPVLIPFDFAAVPDLEEESARVADPVRVSGTVRLDGGRCLVEGRISGDVECDCSRCLAALVLPLKIGFRDIFVPYEEVADEGASELADPDLDVSEFDGRKIDLIEVAREQILLAIPEQVFCRPDCRGLCASCGADLNTGPCACGESETDPRWAELKKLKF